MYQSVYNDLPTTQAQVVCTFDHQLAKEGNYVYNEFNFGFNTQINAIKAIRLKRLRQFAEHLNDTNLIHCCLPYPTTTKQLLNTLSLVLR